MRGPMMAREIDPSSFGMSDQYYVKRTIAYAIDAFIAIVPVALLLLAFEADFGKAMTWVALVLVSGAVIVLFKGIVEFLRRESPGKYLMKMRVQPLGEDLTIADSMIRNVSTIVPFLVPAVDLLIGYFTSMDARQKLTDGSTETLVIEILPAEVREIVRRPPVAIETPEKPERIRLGFDQGYAKGNCPRCGAPYRVLPPNDQRFNGLWNHRCTWCNCLIQETF